ncbi:hypothetical protein V6N12_014173 [Hibiscus sabdariffa]|uniref:Uncharacterized protein n=1 Tax=Hibiscus sabdariffa TaxID=183260 RepID=A0ABR2DJD6_9ROSI
MVLLLRPTYIYGLDLARQNTIVGSKPPPEAALTYDNSSWMCFSAHQAWLKLTHVINIKHIFVVGNFEKRFEIVPLKYPFLHRVFWGWLRNISVSQADMTSSSFRDAIMAMLLSLLENFRTLPSFLCGLKAETTQIFMDSEKLSEKELSLSFLVLTAMPLHGYLIELRNKDLLGWKKEVSKDLRLLSSLVFGPGRKKLLGSVAFLELVK